MDPNANVAEQRRLRRSKNPDDRARLRELRIALREWIARGGFPPERQHG